MNYTRALARNYLTETYLMFVSFFSIKELCLSDFTRKYISSRNDVKSSLEITFVGKYSRKDTLAKVFQRYFKLYTSPYRTMSKYFIPMFMVSYCATAEDGLLWNKSTAFGNIDSPTFYLSIIASRYNE